MAQGVSAAGAAALFGAAESLAAGAGVASAAASSNACAGTDSSRIYVDSVRQVKPASGVLSSGCSLVHFWPITIPSLGNNALAESPAIDERTVFEATGLASSWSSPATWDNLPSA